MSPIAASTQHILAVLAFLLNRAVLARLEYRLSTISLVHDIGYLRRLIRPIHPSTPWCRCSSQTEFVDEIAFDVCPALPWRRHNRATSTCRSLKSEPRRRPYRHDDNVHALISEKFGRNPGLWPIGNRFTLRNLITVCIKQGNLRNVEMFGYQTLITATAISSFNFPQLFLIFSQPANNRNRNVRCFPRHTRLKAWDQSAILQERSDYVDQQFLQWAFADV